MQNEFKTIDGLVNALYRAVSFKPQHNPDYSLLRSLFAPGGRITPPVEDGDGSLKSLTVEEFIESFDAKLKRQNFISVGANETELERSVLTFHRVAHVFSSYNFTLNEADTPIARGVNALQLVHHESRWWILGLTWDRAKAQELLSFHSSEETT